MKNILCVVAIIAIIIVPIFTSCSAAKIGTVKNHTFTITLKERLNGKYIINEYAEYKPSNVSNSNKTLNEYRATFECRSDKLDEVLELMKNDEQILTIADQKTGGKLQTTKNVKHAKTGPIKSSNN